MCEVRTRAIVLDRHFKAQGGGIIVHHEWPEHIARACAAIRRRRMNETEFRLISSD